MFDEQEFLSGGTSEADCFDCPIGHYCEEGSKAPTQCPRGTYGNETNLGACISCEAGTFQGDLGQTMCQPCLPGGYCEEGAVAPIPCMAGTFSSATGLSSYTECETCPAGFYCDVGSTGPTPCPAGKVGTEFGRVAETFCISCKGDTTSLPGKPSPSLSPSPITLALYSPDPALTLTMQGTTNCSFCNVNFYPSPQADPTVRHASNTKPPC
jgi:hypothetical protein